MIETINSLAQVKIEFKVNLDIFGKENQIFWGSMLTTDTLFRIL